MNLLIYKSTNGGLSWSAISSQGAVGFQTMLIDPMGALYMTAPGGLRKSTDGGAGWAPLNISFGLPVSCLTIDPQSTLYTSGNSVLKSADAGASWVQANSGLPQGYGIVALAIDIQSPGNVYAVADIYECGTGTPAAGIYRSTDGGGTWTGRAIGYRLRGYGDCDRSAKRGYGLRGQQVSRRVQEHRCRSELERHECGAAERIFGTCSKCAGGRSAEFRHGIRCDYDWSFPEHGRRGELEQHRARRRWWLRWPSIHSTPTRYMRRQ